jgi:trans-aconitate methyltransferase
MERPRQQASAPSWTGRRQSGRARSVGHWILACGRGQKTYELATRGWEAVGIDNIPRAIEAATRHGVAGATFVVGDVTDLAKAELRGASVRGSGRLRWSSRRPVCARSRVR